MRWIYLLVWLGIGLWFLVMGSIFNDILGEHYSFSERKAPCGFAVTLNNKVPEPRARFIKAYEMLIGSSPGNFANPDYITLRNVANGTTSFRRDTVDSIVPIYNCEKEQL